MNNLERTLTEALSAARVTSLPKAKTDDFWIEAVVKVKKCDNSENYALAVNSCDGKPSIVRDFGNMARITSIEEIYPYAVMDKTAVPDLRNSKAIATYLVSNANCKEDEVMQLMSRKKADGTAKSEEEIAADRAVVKNLVTKTAFKIEMYNRNQYVKALSK